MWFTNANHFIWYSQEDINTKKQIRQGAVLGIADEFLYEIVRDEDCQGVVPSVSVKCTTEKDSRENVKYLNI